MVFDPATGKWVADSGNKIGFWSEDAIDDHQFKANPGDLQQGLSSVVYGNYLPSVSGVAQSSAQGYLPAGAAAASGISDFLKSDESTINVSDAGGAVNTTPKLSAQDSYYNALTTKLEQGNDPWSMSGVGGLALGGVQTGVALLGTLDQMKTAKLQRNLLGQQYDTNAEKMQSWRDNKTAVNKAFGGGLAAQGQ